MSLLSTAQEQREKEANALRFSLIYCLIASIVIHIGVLVLGMSNFLIRFPQVKDEAIEVTLIEMPNQEVKKLPENQKPPSKVNFSGSSVGGGGRKSGQQQTAIGADTSSMSVVKQPHSQSYQHLLPKKIQTIVSPIQKLADTLKTPPKQPTETSKQVVSKTEIANEPSVLTNSSVNKLVERLKTPPQKATISTEPSKSVATTIPTVLGRLTSPSFINSQSNGKERSLTSSHPTGNGITKGSENAANNGSGNGVGNNSGDGISNGSGNGVGNTYGNGFGNQPKKENTTVATDPKPPADNNSRLDSADCLKCEIKYPDRARRRGVEGNPEIAVDTDNNGNVTHVRLIHSSGDRELDEAAKKAAEEWRLKPISGGRQGVRASVNFAIKGSPRHRELEERQRQREAARKKPETNASIPTPETPTLRQRDTVGVVKDIPLARSTRRNRKSAPSPQTTPRKRVESEATDPSLETKPSRPQQIESNTPSLESKSERVQRRRKRLEDILRRRPQPGESPENSSERVQRRRKRLEDILRRRPQPGESPKIDAPAPSSKLL